MSWDESLTELLDLLVTNFDDPATARDIAQRAGLSTRYIKFSGSIDNVWMDILREARKSTTGLEDLAQAVQKAYPKVDFVTLVWMFNSRTIKGPKLTPGDWKGPPSAADGLEKVVGGQPTFLPINFLETGVKRARSVARVVCPGGMGTGFLTRDDLFITNHHVLPSEEVARNATVQFNLQKTLDGLAAPVAEFRLVPDEGFATSPQAGGDDWTAVRVAGNPGATWGSLELADVSTKVNDYVNIVQHPGGLDKQIALYHNVVAYVGGNRVQYLTDTLPGSSGSPVFDSEWRVVALHHSGGWLVEPGTGSKRVFFRNEGIQIGAIVKGLRDHQL